MDLSQINFGWWEIFLGALCTIAIFSFLYRENPFYRFFEYFYIGIATGIGLFAIIKTFFWPQLIKPLFGLDRIPYPDGAYPESYNYNNLWLIVPIIFGSLYYFILSKRFSWIAQIVIGFTLGVSGGLAFEGTINELFPQIKSSFKPLYVPGDLFQSFSNIIFILCLVLPTIYFLFTFKRRPQGNIEKCANTGRWLLMFCFGAFFGATIMARMALLVERINFLLGPVIRYVVSFVSGD